MNRACPQTASHCCGSDRELKIFLVIWKLKNPRDILRWYNWSLSTFHACILASVKLYLECCAFLVSVKLFLCSLWSRWLTWSAGWRSSSLNPYKSLCPSRVSESSRQCYCMCNDLQGIPRLQFEPGFSRSHHVSVSSGFVLWPPKTCLTMFFCYHVRERQEPLCRHKYRLCRALDVYCSPFFSILFLEYSIP